MHVIIMKRIRIRIALVFILSCPLVAWAGQTVKAVKADQDPVVDGIGNETAWQKATPVVTRDDTAGIDIVLRA